MYYADSDLLTIVLYVIVMAAGIYSSFKKELVKTEKSLSA